MKDKGILKIISQGKDRMMHFTVEQNIVKSLSLNDTDLIEELRQNPNVEAIFEIKGGETVPVVVKIVEDKNEVQKIFERMLAQKNTWFKEYDERLLVLEVYPK